MLFVTPKSFHIHKLFITVSAHVVFQVQVFTIACLFMSSKNLNQTDITSAVPSNNIAHDAVCQSNNVNMYMPPLHTIGRAARKQNRHTPAVTCKICIKLIVMKCEAE